MSESIPGVLENKDTSNLVQLENSFWYPFDAEDGDDDIDDDVDDDEVRAYAYRDSTILCKEQIELKHGVSVEPSGHACHLQTTNIA